MYTHRLLCSWRYLRRRKTKVPVLTELASRQPPYPGTRHLIFLHAGLRLRVRMPLLCLLQPRLRFHLPPPPAQDHQNSPSYSTGASSGYPPPRAGAPPRLRTPRTGCRTPGSQSLGLSHLDCISQKPPGSHRPRSLGPLPVSRQLWSLRGELVVSKGNHQRRLPQSLAPAGQEPAVGVRSVWARSVRPVSMGSEICVYGRPGVCP